MADGEGRPLDEIEAGDEDPQGWYFDLPGGAWERQEEKNRTLRQRVLGNLTEEDETRKREPFATRPPEPEPEKKGGLFGFGRKKKEAEKPRESAGGTWVLNRGTADDDGEDDGPDDWSTEPPLNLPPAQSEPILLRRRPQDDRDGDPWGPADGGFSLGDGARDEDPAFEQDEDDGLAGMKAWARAGAEQLGDEAEEPVTFESPDEFEPAASVEAFDEGDSGEPDAFGPVPVYAEGEEEPASGDEDFLSGMRAWAESEDEPAAALVEAVDDSEMDSTGAEDEVPAAPLLRLRPRSHDDDGKRLDWSFGPRGWDADEPASEPGDEDSLEAMRAWAERNREADHPHFTTEHKDETEEPAAELPPPLPLRPLHRDEPEARKPLEVEPAPPMDGPRDLPLIRRGSLDNEAPPRDPNAGPSKWDEFFNLKPDAEADDAEGDEPAGISEGLSAMRDWAKAKPEATKEQPIPEEFLKPFDWETEEDGQSATDEIPDELLKPFDWEVDQDSGGDDADSEELPAAASLAAERLQDSISLPAATDEGDDDIFSIAAPAPVTPDTEKKAGLIGRLFGRKKKQGAEPQLRDEEEDPGDWILPSSDDEDMRTAEPAASLTDDESEDGTEWTAAASSVFAGDSHRRSGTAGWGGSRLAGWTDEDQEAISSFADELVTPSDSDEDSAAEFAAEGPPGMVTVPEAEEAAAEFIAAARLGDEEQDEPEGPEEWVASTPDDSAADAPAAELDAMASAADEDEEGWAPEPVVAFTAASVDREDEEPVEAVAEQPVEAVAEVDEPAVAEETPWWERPAVEDEEPVEAVAEQPVEAVAEVAEPAVADETPWWERPAVEDDEPVEAVAEQTVEAAAVVPEPAVADEKPWWERPAVEDEEPVEAVAEQPVEAVTEVAEPAVAEEKPWWERSAVEDEEPVEAVAEQPVEAVAEADEPAVAEEKPWWERSAVEDEEPVEAVAEQPVEAVTEVAEPAVAEEKPWWERPAVEDDEPVEAVAEQPAEAVAEVAEPAVAEEKPWWERPAVEDEDPVEGVAEQPVEDVAEMAEPAVADEKPWWERPAVEDEEPIEAVAEQPAEAAAQAAEPAVAEEKPWWERSAVEGDEPIEAVAEQPVEAVVEMAEPAATRKWWEEATVDDEPGDVADIATQSAAFVEPVEDDSPWAAVDEPAASAEDDPWADFVTGASEAPVASFETPRQPSQVAPAAQPETEAPAEDMWGDIAARAEEAMHSRADEDRLDLAASLESQMAEQPGAPAYSWQEQERGWDSEAEDSATGEDEEDVILRAFEAHAATPDKAEEPDPEVIRETEQALAALFGKDAEDIVAESADENEQSFIRMSAWAPQRSTPMDGGWAAEEEVEIELSGASLSSIGTSDFGFAPPPWAVDEFEGGASPAGVRRHNKTKTWIRELVETGLLALLVFLSVRASFQNFKVDGSSMYPTLEDGQFLIVNKLVYSEVDMEKLGDFIPFIDAGDDPKRHVFHGPERGDIIVLRDPRNPETDLIKRVIGLPGETIEIVDGKVYINDLLLEEPYITAPWSDNKAKILIPDGEYFVMGDNRDNSLDSRSSQVGLVQEDLIIGKAMLSYWPKAKFGLAPNEAGELTDQKPVLTTQRLDD